MKTLTDNQRVFIKKVLDSNILTTMGNKFADFTSGTDERKLLHHGNCWDTSWVSRNVKQIYYENEYDNRSSGLTQQLNSLGEHLKRRNLL